MLKLKISKTSVLFCLALLVLVSLRYQQNKPKFREGDSIRITFVVRSEPVIYDISQYLRIHGLKIYLPLYPRVNYGDKVVLEGTVSEGKLSHAKLVNLQESRGVLYKLRLQLLNVFKRSLPTDEAALFAGVVLGSKSQISGEFWNQLKNSGTAHVVVASGMNVTLIAGFLISVSVIFLNRKIAIYFVLVGIWIYSLLTGFDAPIVRASIMGSIAFVAQEFGRLNSTIRAVVVSAAVMLMIFPQWLTDIGFILSFCATLSLIVFTPTVKNIMLRFSFTKYVPKPIQESLTTTISAQIGVVPVLFFSFGNYNPLSIIANALVLWVVPIITMVGFIGEFAGLIYLPLGRAVLLIGYPLAKYFTTVVRLFG